MTTLTVRDPVEELDAACAWLRLLDDMLRSLGQEPCTAPVRADLAAIAGWLNRHPHVADNIALNMPTQPTQDRTTR